MSFLDDVFEIGKQAVGWLTSGSTGANLAKTVITGFALNQVNKSVNKENALPAPAAANNAAQAVDRGARLQVNPDPEHSIPVVYGTATLGGIITHVELTNNNSVLYAVTTLCERTGIKLSDSTASVFTIPEIRINDQKVVFNAGGQVVNYTMDREGNVDNSLKGLVEIRCYIGSSQVIIPDGYSGGNTQPAYDFIPAWSATDTMNDLVFVAMKITYSREKNITSIPTVTAKISNSMTMPGDCIYDYMTNTRYGAGIPASEIYSV